MKDSNNNDMMLTVMPIEKKTDHGRRYHVYIEIRYERGNLSISGEEGPLRSGNSVGCGGQICQRLMGDKLGEDYQLVNQWTQEMYRKLLDIWDKWHLNDLHAGCEHQRSMGWEEDGYGMHPSEPCPICGYKYGTAWHKISVPEDVIEWLFSLPPAARPHPWHI